MNGITKLKGDNMAKYLIHSVTIVLSILTLNHYYRYLNYKPIAVLLFFWIIASFIMIRLEESKW
jgi:predicted ferric reductase